MNRSDDSRNTQAGSGTAPQQQGSRATSSQQEQFSPPSSQQGQPGGAMTRSGGGGMPSLWGRGGPFELMRRLDEDMDRLFNQFWGGGRSLMRGRGAAAPQMWMPQVEMCERGGKLHVFTDLPGMRKEDVKLSIDGDQLVIEGERRSSHDEGAQQQGGFFHSERSYGSFYRSIPLPEGVDATTVDASFKDGVLDVCFDAPKQQQPKSRQVQIRDGSSAPTGTSQPGAQSQQSSGGSQQ